MYGPLLKHKPRTLCFVCQYLRGRNLANAGGYLAFVQVSRASVYKQLLENSLRVLLDKIPHLNEKTMLDLLNDSFRYAGAGRPAFSSPLAPIGLGCVGRLMLRFGWC